MRLRSMMTAGLYGALLGGVTGAAIWAGMMLFSRPGPPHLENEIRGYYGNFPRFRDNFRSLSSPVASLVMLQLEVGDFDGVSASINKISSAEKRFSVLTEVINELEAAEAPLLNKNVVGHVKSLLPSEPADERLKALNKIGRLQLQLEEKAEAQRTFAEAVELIGRLPDRKKTPGTWRRLIEGESAQKLGYLSMFVAAIGFLAAGVLRPVLDALGNALAASIFKRNLEATQERNLRTPPGREP